ncbi:hypothetical protein JHK82_040219 [Glycine max]|nr:hypothetical protein JHK86_040418 [Glycine max]KAG5110996.1 hypothetical protein JHK82_040219 [Glycine max]
MHTHLDICKKKPDIMSKRQKLDSSSTTITLSSSSMIDQEACRIALVKLFVASELSFSISNLVIPSCRPVKVWQKLQVYARGNDVNLTDYKGKVLAYLNDIYVHVLTMLDLSTKCRVILKSNCYHKEGHQTPCKYGEEVYMMLLD